MVAIRIPFVKYSDFGRASVTFIMLPIILFGFVILIMSFSFYQPMWDAGWYYSVLLDATAQPFNPSLFNLVGHRSVAYALIVGGSQFLDPGNQYVLHATNLFLALLAAVAFDQILKCIAPGFSQFERAVGVGCFLFMPALSSNLLHLNLDFGVTVFLVLTVWAILYNYLWCACIFGFCMSFSKEMGAALYGALVVIHLALQCVTVKPRWSLRMKAKKDLVLLLPTIYYGYKIISYKIAMPTSPPVYTETALEVLTWSQFFFDFNLFDGKLQSYLFNIFLLNFNWMLLLPCLMLVLYSFSSKQRAKFLFDRNHLLLFLFLLVGVYLVTRVRPFNHVRYVMSVMPLFLLMSLSILSFFDGRKVLRASFLTSIFCLFVYANFETKDPVSRWFFGVRQFGQHEILNMSSKFFSSNESHTDFNRDELVYNLQFIAIQKLWNKAIHHIHPSPNTLVLGSEGMQLYYPPRVNLSRTDALSWKKTDQPWQFTDSIEDLQRRGVQEPVLYFISLPPMADLRTLAYLDKEFRRIDMRVISWNGYDAELYSFDTTKGGV